MNDKTNMGGLDGRVPCPGCGTRMGAYDERVGVCRRCVRVARAVLRSRANAEKRQGGGC